MAIPKKQIEVLRFLMDHGDEIHGLGIVKASGGRIKRGTVYSTLDKLEQKGLVISRPEEPGQYPGNPRRLYKVTGQASLVLDAYDGLGLALEGRRVSP